MASFLSTGLGSRLALATQPPHRGLGHSQPAGTVGPSWTTITRRQRLYDAQREVSGYEASSSQSTATTIHGWSLVDNGYAGMSEGLWGATVTGGRDDIEAMPSSSERVLRKQVSALQVQLSVAEGELDDVRKTARRTAAENEALRARIGHFEAASRDKQLALQRAQSDLAFCGNTEKQQLWSSLSESKRRIISLQDKLTATETRAAAVQKQLMQQRAQFQTFQMQHEVAAFLLVYALFRLHSH
ncbi:hypothetical protein COCSUDRAFT_53993 [Coccomyxa subellipsoidea C-169]|uniref:Uncharacterized protein n=1 Tax=Coccomyxa subellipsoidea (strain C-169) TaxID=574566 RepID=I0YSS9_COCSC|nr:hypothetical protein COCSUDRAFT_53993 [Coccomyxa subellipsoidea C-169]EIE21448.1 hypothetical protein COCSUDRAFT_53993 [Coccomyxa subellipsoidea C-169]|eukprot:XP_005645992.1 hypothetical protein COCSUDRAFT_53993 [Coccomyxa subellipsoidea C-169]